MVWAQKLRASVAWLTLKLSPPGARIVDERTPPSGEPVRNDYTVTGGSLRIGLRPGKHLIRIEKAGHARYSWSFDAAERQLLSRTIELTRRTPSSRLVPVFVALGGTVALGAAAVGTGVAALDRSADFDAANDGSNAAAATKLRDEAQTLTVATDVLLGATAVGAVVTTVLFFTRDDTPEREQAWHLAPLISGSGGGYGATVTGQF